MYIFSVSVCPILMTLISRNNSKNVIKFYTNTCFTQRLMAKVVKRRRQKEKTEKGEGYIKIDMSKLVRF